MHEHGFAHRDLKPAVSYAMLSPTDEETDIHFRTSSLSTSHRGDGGLSLQTSASVSVQLMDNLSYEQQQALQHLLHQRSSASSNLTHIPVQLISGLWETLHID